MPKHRLPSGRLCAAALALVLGCAGGGYVGKTREVGGSAMEAREVKAGTVKKGETWHDMTFREVSADVFRVPPPADVEARRAAFAERNSPESVETLSKDLFALWDFDNRSVDRAHRDWQRFQKMKDEAVRFYKEGKHAEALGAFRAYFVPKVQRECVLPGNHLLNRFADRWQEHIARLNEADEFMRGVLITDFDKKRNLIGPPGEVNWDHVLAQQNPWDNGRAGVLQNERGLSPFDPLWWKFFDTKDARYLERWCAYVDDWTMNHHYWERLSSMDLDSPQSEVTHALVPLIAVATMAPYLGDGGELLPETTLARILVRIMRIHIPVGLFYCREESNNHLSGRLSGMFVLAGVLSDFRIGAEIEHVGRRALETFLTLKYLPDGSMDTKMEGYAFAEFEWMMGAYQTLKQLMPPWFTPSREQEFLEPQLRRAAYCLRIHSTEGEGPVSLKSGRYLQLPRKAASVQRFLPKALEDPATVKVVAAILRNLHGRKDGYWGGLETHEGLSDLVMIAGGREPEFASETYPYQELSVMRSGWTIDDDQYGVFHTLTGGGGLVRGARNNCEFALSAFGFDLLVSGVPYCYNYVDSPVMVDGLSQNNHFGTWPIGRKGLGGYGAREVARRRTLHSRDFDFIEGTYAGVYTENAMHDPQAYTPKAFQMHRDTAIRGVRHHRTVSFVKRHGLWILVDRMTSAEPHTYTQQFYMPRICKDFKIGYAPEQVVQDRERLSVRTEAPGMVNVSMYHFGPVATGAGAAEPGPLTYDEDMGKKQNFRDITTWVGYRNDRSDKGDWIHLKSSWRGAGGGDEQLITVIYPRKRAEDGLASIEPLARDGGGTCGFRARTPQGATISYAANIGRATRLTLGDVSAVAESLLVVREADGATWGAVTGCDRIAAPGGQLDAGADGPDFEFELAAGRPVRAAAILPPIARVGFLPETDVFVDELEVSMTCPTEGVDIRYTLDGTDPTPASAVYERPFTITDSARIKARAFRKGLTAMPVTMDGTHMSVVTLAEFKKEEPLPAEPSLAGRDLKPGLAYRYYEGSYAHLVIDRTGLEPVRTGSVPRAFDISPRGEGSERAFAFEYSGFIDVAADGVYTFHAPSEFVRYSPLSGYDLDLEVGYRMRYHNSRPNGLDRGRLNRWYPVTRRHAFGTWSIALAKGRHPFRLAFVDVRPGADIIWFGGLIEGTSVKQWLDKEHIWQGTTPELLVSGPGMEKQEIPAAMLLRE